MVKRKFPYILVIDFAPECYFEDGKWDRCYDWMARQYEEPTCEFIWNPSYKELKDIPQHCDVLAFNKVDGALLFKLEFPEAVIEYRDLNAIC